MRPRFAMMHWSEAYGAPHPMVATCLASASALKAMPGPAVKAFLAWDLEWMRAPGAFRDMLAVYGCPYLRLLARGPDHAALLKSCWGREAASVGEWEAAALVAALS